MTRSGYFDLVLTDDKTEGTDELAHVIALIRQSPWLAVLMIVTGNEKTLTLGARDSTADGLRSAPFCCLEKPVDLGLLIDTVESAI